MNNSRYLITTSYELLWPDEKPVIFMGDWCIPYDKKNKAKPYDSIIAKPLGGNSMELMDKDILFVRNLEEFFLSNLVPWLNNIHGRNENKRYWKIILGCWLRRFITVFFNRYYTLKNCIEEYDISGVTFFEHGNYNLTVDCSNAFIRATADSIWNSEFWSRIWHELNTKDIKTKYIKNSDQLEFRLPPVAKSAKHRLFLESITRFCSSGSEVMMINTYLPKKIAIKLHLSLKQFPQFWSQYREPITEIVDETMRTSLKTYLDKKAHTDFERICGKLFSEVLPICFLEGFDKIEKNGMLMGWPKKPKTIFTSNSFDTDEEFKIWAANKVKQGTKYIIGQHGNAYCTHKHHNPHVEQTIADKFITWGSNDDYKTHTDGFIFTHPKNGLLKYNSNGKILLIELSAPLQFYLHDEVDKFKYYFSDQLDFVSKLPNDIRRNLVIRLAGFSSKLFENEPARWKQFDSNLILDNFSCPIKKAIAESKLVIFSYDSTGLLECLSQNVPTLGFWKNPIEQVRSSAVPYYKVLLEAGIIHSDPKSIAKKVQEINGNIDSWWQSKEIQNARKMFVNKYARQNDSPVDFLKNILSTET